MLTVNKRWIGEIPCFEITPKNAVPKADILLYHGWGSHATKQCFRGKLLAGFGYRVLVPEISLHGERGSCDYESSESVVHFMEVLLQSIQEASVLVREGLCSERSGFIIGHSLGGMIALGTALENGAALDGIVAMNSTAQWDDYAKIMQGVFPGQSLARLGCDEFVELSHLIERYAPKNWNVQGIEIPVLLTNGALDQILPSDFNAAFCSTHQALNVRQVVFPEAGHVVTDGMLAEVIAFVESNIKPGK